MPELSSLMIPDYLQLQTRLGDDLIHRRLHRQTTHIARICGGGRTRFHIENMQWLHAMIAAGLHLTGLRRRAHRNALTPIVRNNSVAIKNLPPGFEGFRLLHLSDLHCDLDDTFIPALAEQIAVLDYDACLITGDFRFHTYGSYTLAMSGMQQLKAAIKAPTYAVLGNHDYLEMTTDLEAMGIRVLLNENISIERNGSRIWIAGVDDAHFYETADLDMATGQIPAGEPIILMAHSPDVYAQAARKAVALMLCGHTHGGQICLPGGFMVIKNSRCHRRFCKGPWQHEQLVGYTSCGTGSSGMAARLNCPSEIVIHQLFNPIGVTVAP